MAKPQEQRDIDRAEELARQKEVTDALDAFYVEQRKEAEFRLGDPKRRERQEQAQNDEISAALNKATKETEKKLAAAAAREKNA